MVRLNIPDCVPGAARVRITAGNRSKGPLTHAGAALQRTLHIAGQTAVAWELEEAEVSN